MEFDVRAGYSEIVGNRCKTTFMTVSRKVRKTVKCQECDKKLSRSTTITNTVSPFNKNKDGTQRTLSQVKEHINELCLEWNPEVKSCEDHRR